MSLPTKDKKIENIKKKVDLIESKLLRPEIKESVIQHEVAIL